jgi:hypothetical protein
MIRSHWQPYSAHVAGAQRKVSHRDRFRGRLRLQPEPTPANPMQGLLLLFLTLEAVLAQTFFMESR